MNTQYLKEWQGKKIIALIAEVLTHQASPAKKVEGKKEEEPKKKNSFQISHYTVAPIRMFQCGGGKVRTSSTAKVDESDENFKGFPSKSSSFSTNCKTAPFNALHSPSSSVRPVSMSGPSRGIPKISLARKSQKLFSNSGG